MNKFIERAIVFLLAHENKVPALFVSVVMAAIGLVLLDASLPTNNNGL